MELEITFEMINYIFEKNNKNVNFETSNSIFNKNVNISKNLFDKYKTNTNFIQLCENLIRAHLVNDQININKYISIISEEFLLKTYQKIDILKHKLYNYIQFEDNNTHNYTLNLSEISRFKQDLETIHALLDKLIME